MSFFQKSKYGKRFLRKLVIISAQLSVWPLNMGVTPPPPPTPLSLGLLIIHANVCFIAFG